MSGSKTQKQHLADLTLSFTQLNEILEQHLKETGLTAEIATAVEQLGRSVHGLDLRLINEEIAHRVIEGSETAVRAVVDKPRALSNRDVAVTAEGLKVSYEEAKTFLHNCHDTLGTHFHTQFFPGTLSLVSKMMEVADEDEKKTLVNLAAKARVQATS